MNVKSTIAALFTLVMLSYSAQAQKLVLCESYSTEGVPSGIYTTWDISSTGSYVYMVYDQPANFITGVYYIYIDKYYENSSSYGAYLTVEMKPESTKNWIVLDQLLTEAGDYKASFMFNGTAMATNSFNVQLKDATAKTLDTNNIDTYYYESSQILFGMSVDDQGYLLGESETFYLGSNPSITLKAYLTNEGLPFRTNLCYVDIFKGESESAVDSFEINVEPDWDFVHFSVEFREPGTYYIDIYNEDDIFINTAEITIEK